MWQQPATQSNPNLLEKIGLQDISLNEVSNPNQVKFPVKDNGLYFMTFFCAPGGAWAHYTAGWYILGLLAKGLEWLWALCLVKPEPHRTGSGVISSALGFPENAQTRFCDEYLIASQMGFCSF